MTIHLVFAAITILTLISIQIDENPRDSGEHEWKRYKLPLWVWLLAAVCVCISVSAIVAGALAMFVGGVIFCDKIFSDRDDQFPVRVWWLGGYNWNKTPDSKLGRFLTRKI